MRRFKVFFILLFSFVALSFGQETTYTFEQNISYYDDTMPSDDYMVERCLLDIYYPSNSQGYPTVVWFHGGGLTAGNKEIPEALKDKGVAVVGVNYRLFPKVNAPKYIEDAAAAVA
jgi:acetyl esterase/lipase